MKFLAKTLVFPLVAAIMPLTACTPTGGSKEPGAIPSASEVVASAAVASASPPAASTAGPTGSERAPIPGGFKRAGVEVVQDDFVVVGIVDLAPGEVALVDAGVAEDAGPVLAALSKRGLGVDAVKAIFLTHGDFDHTRGVSRFPQAQVLALDADVALVEGRAAKHPGREAKLTGIKVNRALRDGETVELGGVRFEVFAVPGHTPGSAAYIARGVLFMGDSAGTSVEGKLLPGDPQHTVDQPLNRTSLRALAERLAPRAAEIEAMVMSHTKSTERGLAPLLEFAAANKD